MKKEEFMKLIEGCRLPKSFDPHAAVIIKNFNNIKDQRFEWVEG